MLELYARKKQVGEILRLIRHLRREIRYSGAPLHHILASPSCPKNLPIFRWFQYEEPFDLTENYCKAKDFCRGEIFLSSEEKEALDDLFFDLGQGDQNEQERLLSLSETVFVQSEEQIKELLSKNGKSALVLGGAAGAVLVLLLL